MIHFQDKRILRRIMYSRSAIVFLFSVLVLLLFANYHGYEKMRATKERLLVSSNEASVLESKEKELVSRLESLKTERGVEEEIRKKFRVVKDGEEVIIVVGKEENNAVSSSTEEPNTFWKWVLGVFK